MFLKCVTNQTFMFKANVLYFSVLNSPGHHCPWVDLHISTKGHTSTGKVKGADDTGGPQLGIAHKIPSGCRR